MGLAEKMFLSYSATAVAGTSLSFRAQLWRPQVSLFMYQRHKAVHQLLASVVVM